MTEETEQALVEELARALCVEDGTCPDRQVAPYDTREGWMLYKGAARAILHIIRREREKAMVEGARRMRDRAAEAADATADWMIGHKTGIGSSILAIDPASIVENSRG